MTAGIALTVNGQPVNATVEPRTHLADFLREEQNLTGTHLGCEQGVCGACTLFVDGRPVRSCITLAATCAGADVRTVEGFDDDALMMQLRGAFKRHHALQCGYCTPGMLATAYDIVRRLPDADERRIRIELSGNLCRCTGYAGIVAAIRAVLEEGPAPAGLMPMPRRARGVTTSSRAEPAATGVMPGHAPEAGTEAPIMEGELDGAPTLQRSVLIDADRAAAWAVLRDVSAVAECVQGAVLDGPARNGALSGRLEVALGPVTARFLGNGVASFDDAAHRGRLEGRGRDVLTRTGLVGTLDFEAIEEGEATRLDLVVHYRLKGPLAQFGRPAVVEAVADQLLGDTAVALSRRAQGGAPMVGETRDRRLGGFGLIGAVLKAAWVRLLRRN